MPRRCLAENPMLFEIIFCGDLPDTWWETYNPEEGIVENWATEREDCTTSELVYRMSLYEDDDPVSLCETGKYAIDIKETTVGLSFVNNVKNIFGNIPLSQISCVFPYRVTMDVSILMGYKNASKMINKVGYNVFSWYNQIYCKVDHASLNRFVYVDVCRRLWSTSERAIQAHNPSDDPSLPFEDNINYIYYPCINIDPESLIQWWLDEGCPTGDSFDSSSLVGHPFANQPTRYDLLYGFYRTRFVGDDPRTNFDCYDSSVPVPMPIEQSLNDFWFSGFTPITKCAQWHIEVDETTDVGIAGGDPWKRDLPRCRCGHLLYMWSHGDYTYKDKIYHFYGDDLFWNPIDDPDSEIVGLDTTSLCHETLSDFTDGEFVYSTTSDKVSNLKLHLNPYWEWEYTGGTGGTGDTGDIGGSGGTGGYWRSDSNEWPGRYYKKWTPEDSGFAGWQMYCCDSYVTIWEWVDSKPRMNHFLYNWFRDAKTIEDWCEVDTKEEYKYWPYYFQKKYAEFFGTGSTGGSELDVNLRWWEE